jgi:gas vesicle protein
MRYEDGGQFNFVAGMVFGALIGAGAALLMAPDSGKKTRKRLGRAADDLKESAADRWDEIADDVKDKVDEALATAKKRVR